MMVDVPILISALSLEVTDDEKNAAIAQQEAVSKEEFLKRLSARFGGGAI